MEDNIMANTRKSRVPKEEQLKLINECRTSGMTDIDWCREHGIAVSTFYYWVKQLRKKAAQIPVYCILKIPTIAEGNPESCMRNFPIIADAFGISLRPQQML